MGEEKWDHSRTGDLGGRWQIPFLSFQLLSPQCAHPEAPSLLHYSRYTMGLKDEWIGSLFDQPASKEQSQTHTKKQNEWK